MVNQFKYYLRELIGSLGYYGSYMESKCGPKRLRVLLTPLVLYLTFAHYVGYLMDVSIRFFNAKKILRDKNNELKQRVEELETNNEYWRSKYYRENQDRVRTLNELNKILNKKHNK